MTFLTNARRMSFSRKIGWSSSVGLGSNSGTRSRGFARLGDNEVSEINAVGGHGTSNERPLFGRAAELQQSTAASLCLHGSARQ